MSQPAQPGWRTFFKTVSIFDKYQVWGASHCIIAFFNIDAMLRPELAPPASPCNKIETVFLLMPNINNMSCNLCDFSYWLGNSNKACLNQFTRSFSKSMFFNAHLDWHRDFVTILLLSKEGIGNNQTHLRSISSSFQHFLVLVSICQY